FCFSRHPTSSLLPYTTRFRSAGKTSLLDRVIDQLRSSAWLVGRYDAQDDTSDSSAQYAFKAFVRGLRREATRIGIDLKPKAQERSEEHTSELQSRENLVCRLL